MPILNIELIKKAITKINKIKEKVVIKKGQSYTIGNHKVSVRSFEGNNIHVNIVNSQGLMVSGDDIVTSKENLIKAIQEKTLVPIKVKSGVNIFQKRITEIGQPLAEAIASSPTVKVKMTKRGDGGWMTSTPFTDM